MFVCIHILCEDKSESLFVYDYRTGGDEFVIAVKCAKYAFMSKLGTFYSAMKKEINDLGLNIKSIIFAEKEKEWTEANEKLSAAKDRNGNKLNMTCVGISTGIFVSGHELIEKDWLSVADKVALEKAKTLNVPHKNSVAMYFEKDSALIPTEKVSKCMEIGVWEGRK